VTGRGALGDAFVYGTRVIERLMRCVSTEVPSVQGAVAQSTA
jgi:hypothetical protein